MKKLLTKLKRAIKRKQLRKKLERESLKVRQTSLEVLKEMEQLEDRID